MAVPSVPGTAAAVSSVQAPSRLVGYYTLLFSAHMTLAVGFFPWDPGGQEDIAVAQIYILVSNLFPILICSNKGKPRCKRLNPRSRRIGVQQLFSSRASWVSKGGGDVMGSQQAASVHLSWAGPSRPMRYCSGTLQ
jgi:hypothetical protein